MNAQAVQFTRHNSFTKRVFRTKLVFCNDYELNYINWSNEIENILDKNNMTSIFQNRSISISTYVYGSTVPIEIDLISKQNTM